MQLESLDHATLRALLEWQVDLGATEAICEAPINRYEAVAEAPKPALPKKQPINAPIKQPQLDPVVEARKAAAAAGDLQALAAALAAFQLCDLKKGAKNTVVSDGNPDARVMIIGEAPGREEDQVGKPFVGQAGQLLDRMLAAIGLDRDHADPAQSVYITNIMPWRPPQNRNPEPVEIGMMMPFVERHVALVQPDVLVLMGNISCQGVLGRKGITRLRGNWTEAFGCPTLPMFHPAYLLRNPHSKREAWVDLLRLQARLRG